MHSYNERYVVDNDGKRISVMLDISDYKKLLEELEELECIRVYDSAKSSDDQAVPFEQVVSEVEKNRK